MMNLVVNPHRNKFLILILTQLACILPCFPHEIQTQIKKCCGFDEILDLNNMCVKGLKEVEEKWAIPQEFFHSPRNLTAISLIEFGSGRPQCSDSSKRVTKRKLVTDDIHFLPRNLFALLERPGHPEFNASRILLHQSEFCIDISESPDRPKNLSSSPEYEYFIELCMPTCSETFPCIRKCCDPHQIVDLEIFACEDYREGEISQSSSSKASKYRFWEPTIDHYQDQDTTIVADNSQPTSSTSCPPPRSHPTLTHIGEPACKLGSYDIEFRGDSKRTHYNLSKLALLQNGSLFMEFISNEENVVIPWNEFCIDGAQTRGSEEDAEYFSNGIVFVCNPEMEENQEFVDVLKKYREKLYPFLTGISSLFLLLTSIIYFILWKDLNLPGWLQFSYTNSLLIAFILLTVVQLWTKEIITCSENLCKVIGYTFHASFLSCFFWLTSMNIDLWLSFRNTSVPSPFGRSRGKKRYFGFALVSIITPIAVTVAAFITDIEIKKGADRNVELFTGIGETGCAINIQNFLVHFCYFYAVVGTLLGINVMFFICTVFCLRERQRETKFAHRQCTATDSADLIRFRLFTRLFCVMGVLWVFELISWISTFFNLNPKILTVFAITDSLNALQGVAIFFMFVWKPTTWRQLKKKWNKAWLLESQVSLMGDGGNGAYTPKTTSVKSTSTKSSRSSGKTVSSPTSPIG